MAIKNYTSKVSAGSTVSEIQKILATAGCASMSIDYEKGEPIAVRFSILFHAQELWFRLPCNPDGVLASMKRDQVQASFVNIEQARRVSWRIIKDWVHAQLAIIDAGQAQIVEVFLPYSLQSSEQTLFEKFNEQQRLQIGDGGTE